MSNRPEYIKKLFPFIDDQTKCSTCGVDMPIPSDMPTGGLFDARTCETCKAQAARVHVEHDAKMKRESNERQQQEQLAAIAAVIDQTPRHFRDVAREGFGPIVHGRVARREAVDMAYAAVGAPLVVLAGAAGTGKTTLAAAMVGELVKRALLGDAEAKRLVLTRAVGWTVKQKVGGLVWCEAAELARARGRHRLGDGDAPLIERALDADLLVVDELRVDEPDRDHGIADVLWHRHKEELPTIWTTGFTSKEIEVAYGVGFIRRLTEKDFARQINCQPKVAAP